MCGGGGGCGKIFGGLGSLLSFIPGLQPFGLALSAVGQLLPEPKAKTPTLPVPAAPPPATRATGGATVAIGTDASAGAKPRVQQGTRTSSGDVLSGLGRGGLAL